MKSLVLGMGNALISDDGAGIRVAEQVRRKLRDRRDTTVIDGPLSGFSLVDTLAGYDRVIVIDVIQTRRGKPGTIYRMGPGDLASGRNSTMLHDMSLQTALDLGRRLELEMPRELIVYCIEAKDLVTFCEECTPEVKKAIPVVTDLILNELRQNTVGDTAPE